MAIHQSPLKSRYELANLCNKLNLVQFAIEIGTNHGVFACKFLEQWKGNRLICVDPYEPYDEMPWDRSVDRAFAIANLGRFSIDDRIRLVQSSLQAANIIQQTCGQLGFVYIDGNHRLAGVDVDFWWPKMARGGIFAGHDWLPKSYPEIVTAVTNLCQTHSLDCFLIDDSSWYVRVPE
jgi:predicted O-methyltransferase YrrM